MGYWHLILLFLKLFQNQQEKIKFSQLLLPKIVSPIPVDNPKKGVPSDHNGVLGIPISNQEPNRNTTKEIRFVRPMPESSVIEFGKSISSINWPLMIEGLSSSDMVDVTRR